MPSTPCSRTPASARSSAARTKARPPSAERRGSLRWIEMAAPGDLLDGRYRLGPVLGRGGMAEVYRAHDQVTGDDVAVKLLRASDPSTLRWLDREQAALQRLDHPALVRLRATGVDDGRPYLVLDLVEGRSLAELLDAGPLTVGRTTELGAHLAAGLAHAHAAGVTHRDVKPA